MTTYRIGLVVPSSNLTMETELPRILAARTALLPDQEFTFHSSRMRMQHVSPEQLRAMNAQAPRAAQELADAQPDAVATACLVALMAQGPGYHCTAEAEISKVLSEAGVHAPVVSSAGALIQAIPSIGARRVALITPYLKPLTALVADYLENAGIEVVDALSLEVPDNLAVARLNPLDLLDHVRRLQYAPADAVILSACVQMPSLAAVEAAQQITGRPVLTAATATAYSLLTALGLDAVAPGAGRLLAPSAG